MTGSRSGAPNGTYISIISVFLYSWNQIFFSSRRQCRKIKLDYEKLKTVLDKAHLTYNLIAQPTIW